MDGDQQRLNNVYEENSTFRIVNVNRSVYVCVYVCVCVLMSLVIEQWSVNFLCVSRALFQIFKFEAAHLKDFKGEH